jgi:hypothetical protein
MAFHRPRNPERESPPGLRKDWRWILRIWNVRAQRVVPNAFEQKHSSCQAKNYCRQAFFSRKSLPRGCWSHDTNCASALAVCVALVLFPAVAAALDTATAAQPYLAFNLATVGVSPAAAQQLTASFAVIGTDTPTATIHYGYDYTAGAVTCTPNGGGQTCTVPVTFAPTLPGARKDALFLMDGTNLLATVYLGGVGQSPLALVQPGVVTQLVSGASYEQSVSAVGENGTVYILSPNSPFGSNVYSVTKAGVVSAVPVNVIAPNVGIAIDGAGILYIASAAPGSQLITWNTVTQTQGSVSAALPPPYPCSAQSQDPEELAGAAVDAMGDVFTLDEVCQSVIEVKPDGTTAVTSINPGMNADPFRIAVDSSGNEFFGCIDIINELLANGNQSAITNPGDPESRGLAVDAADSLYVIPSPGSGIAELPPFNYQASQASLDPTATILGLGLASDGTLYAGTSTTLDKVDRSQGAIAFGQQTVGTSSAPQEVGIYNGGNESLTLSGITLMGAGSGFAIQAAAVNDCTEGLQLAAGAYCQVAVTLTPPHPGNFIGSIVFSTNSLNNTDSTETVALSGFVPGPYATLSPNPVAFASQNVGAIGAPTAVTLTNTGTLPLATVGISISGADPLAFSQTNACPATLQPTNSCSISVTFTPPGGGPYSASLTVTDNAFNSPQSVPLSGAGLVVQAVNIAEIVHVNDAPSVQLLSHNIAIAEIVHVIDTPSAHSMHAVSISEIVHVNDAPAAMTVSHAVSISEIVHVNDAPSAQSMAHVVAIAETVHVIDAPSAQALSHAISIAETVHVIDTPDAAVTSTAPMLTFASLPAVSYGMAPFPVSASSASSGAITYSIVSGPATIAGNIVTLTDAGAVVVQATQAATLDYTSTSVQTAITVGKQATQDAITASTTSLQPFQSVTFTATVAPAEFGSPTGTVTFYDNGNLLGAPIAVLNGSASYTTDGLTPGEAHTISMTYAGDANFQGGSASLSTSVSVTALTFTLNSPSSGTLTVPPDGMATYTFTISPTFGSYPATVNFSLAGLPAGATYTFTPPSIAANAGVQTITLTITAPAATRLETPLPPRDSRTLWLAGLLPLFLLWRPARRARRAFYPILTLAFLAIAAAGLSGCGSGGFKQAPKNYNLTITAASGSVQSTMNLVLTVK